ncbi:hypothetical protein ACFOD0_14045 [Shewanella intestini]|uniref:DNA gyrase subunit B n=1 Tax=Shewanella intestini TaxID=2017544 RepID=A0ABS5I338_9GAMM|nr:hypothetical protein [Shewanella intestini]MBR9728316.1 DNA gyrase subunit B [Shewanella intestini]
MLPASLLALYPFLVYFGIQQQQTSGLLLILGGAFVARLIFAPDNKPLKIMTYITSTLGLCLVLVSHFASQKAWLLFYPVVINISLSLLFLSSVLVNQPIITAIAKWREPDLPETGIIYTRKLTYVWAVFCAINAVIAAITTTLSMDIWTLYNGLISYVLIGSFMALEWVYRQRVMRRDN